MTVQEQQQDQKQAPIKWKCPECGTKMTTQIALTYPPTCTNPEKHPKKSVTMVTR